MAASETAIGNRALTLLGVARITSLDDESKQARALKSNFDAIRDSELRKAIWTFACKRTTLEALAEAPAWGFARQFERPADLIRLVQVNDYVCPLQMADGRSAPTPPYALEDNRILTDLGAPLKVRYVRRVTDVSMFDPCFDAALAARLAMELAADLTESGGKQDRAAEAYKDAMADARRLNAVEKPAEAPVDDSWVLGRL